MKKLLVLLVLLSSFAFGGTQWGWVYQDVAINGWEIATDEGMAKVNVHGFKNPYGVTVDSTGKVWAAAYYQRYYYDTDGTTKIYPDDIEKTVKGSQGQDSTYLTQTRPIFIRKLDGSIDTLRYLTWADSHVDTLFNGNRGLATLPDGSVLYAADYGILIKINPLTYEPIAEYDLGSTWRTARPDVDADGYIYNISLFGGDVVILDGSDMTLYNTIPATAPGVSRGIACSPNGQHVFIPSQNGGVHHYYNKDGVDGTYALIDTLATTFFTADSTEKSLPSTMALWDPAGLLWVGRQEYSSTDQYIMWAYDPDQDFALVDDYSFRSPTAADTTVYGYSQPGFVRCPRDAAFSKDGMTMYIADFYSYSIKQFHYEEKVGIHDNKPAVPNDLYLGQNYPNPFNPTTRIPFTLAKKANVRLRIYDSLGRQILFAIDQEMQPGEHFYTFDGSNLASGTYYYKLTVDTKVRTGRMMLLK